jgi:hypothetical protein
MWAWKSAEQLCFHGNVFAHGTEWKVLLVLCGIKYRVGVYVCLTVCRVRQCSGLLGFWTLSIVRYSKKPEEHNVSETGSVSVLRWGGRIHSTGPNRVGVSCPSPEDGNRSSFRNVVFFCFFLEYRTMNKVQKPSSPECYIPSSEPFKVYFGSVALYIN